MVSTPNPFANKILQAAKQLRKDLQSIDYSAVADWVYDPLDYAWGPYCEYVTRFARAPVKRIFMGMNPGPWGMAQTGIPFGEVAAVRDWLNIEASVKKPSQEHPKRPIVGLMCNRSEVSGQRLWGLFRDRYQTPRRFFAEHFVINYCPLAFMDRGGRNLTPDKFPKALRQPIEEACDRHLIAVLAALQPNDFIGVGAFAESCGERCIERMKPVERPRVWRILHPSPASPAANRDWAGQVIRTLTEAGIWSDGPT